MPHTAEAFIARLKDQLTEIASAVDAGFPANAELTLDADGNPHLKQQQARSPPEGLVAFEVEVHARMRERHLLDILKSWRLLDPLHPPLRAALRRRSKLAKAERRYILTVFGYGCNLGPGQTARHAPGIASAETLRRINAQHIDTSKIESRDDRPDQRLRPFRPAKALG